MLDITLLLFINNLRFLVANKYMLKIKKLLEKKNRQTIARYYLIIIYK